ncbi:hypothetical protein EXU57_01875 [Segetibacter sp. 3557_3]|nr:hypothetical protein EXU57_01875 [Segetibacter sp. 3557_3]
MKNSIRVGAVSYLNTRPLVYGFKHGFSMPDMQLVEDYPANVAAMLLHDKIDIGLVPVAIIPFLPEHYIVSDYCIGAEGPVGSVCLFSDVPVQQVKSVLLDYQSRTSVALARILIREYWNISPELIDAREDFRTHIKGTTAGVVIGDRAFEQRKQSGFIYDLAEAWLDLTGQPFVFAAWVANKKIPTDFIDRFNAANRFGLANIDAVVAENPYNLYDLTTYFTRNISYELTPAKRLGLKLFLDKIETIKPVTPLESASLV